MKVAFFDTKSYDIPGFEHYAADSGLEIKFFETRLNEDTASLAAGYDAVCVFVNDTVSAACSFSLPGRIGTPSSFPIGFCPATGSR